MISDQTDADETKQNEGEYAPIPGRVRLSFSYSFPFMHRLHVHCPLGVLKFF